MSQFMHQELETLAIVRLIGQADVHVIPAEVLVKTLLGMQQLVYLAASDSENKKLSKRFRVSDEIEQNYKLICKLPQPGSYVVPLALEARFKQLVILSDQYASTFEKVEKLLQCIAHNTIDQSYKIFSDRNLAKRALNEVRKFLPSADDSWKLGFSTAKAVGFTVIAGEVVMSKESVKYIDDWMASELPPESTMTITGELIRIDFDDHKVFLRYPPTRQIIECIYSDELEDVMIESRRHYVQVTGAFTLDANLNPTKLTDVTRIEALDLSPIILSQLSFKKRRFKFKELVQLNPVLDEDGKQLLVVEQPELGLHAFAHTRDELVDEIAEQIAFLWDEYAMAENESLTPEAANIKSALLLALETKDAT